MRRSLALLVSSLVLAACAARTAPAGVAAAGEPFDLLVRGGTVYDGDGGEPFTADVGVRGDRIVAIGDLTGSPARATIEAGGLAVAPGFVNMLSWATESLLVDGRALSDVRQGVTLEVFGEGWSMGPLDEAMKRQMVEEQGDLRFDVTWTTLGEYLETLESRGVSTNVASFVGATTVRIHELGYEDRAPTADELARMVGLVHAAMDEGALGVGSSLIYAPAFYAETEELIALARAAGERGGMYISHMRSEGNRLLEAVDEVLAIAGGSGARAEIYHLKAAGRDNWDKLPALIAKVEAARAAGVEIGADMYTYTAGATGLDAAMPPWVQEGGLQPWIARLRDPQVRARVVAEMRAPSDDWENLLLAAGGAENVLLVGFKNEALKPLTGRTLAAVAAERGRSPEETAMDLVVEDGSRVGTIYFLMSEDNVRRQVTLPWVSFGSDAEAPAPEGVFLRSNPHPRAYGNFARLLGRYVRDEGLLPLAEAVRRLTSLPAANLRLRDRGRLRAGYHADLVVFDPAMVADRATFAEPHQLAVGVRDVVVNGVPVLRDGEHTGARPGRVVRGPGWRGWRQDAAAAGH
jgi:N-acyl-D-amino-acid deacylase